MRQSDERRVSMRLPREVREKVEAEACEKWNGNMSYTILRALREYFGLPHEEPPKLSAPIRFREEAEKKRLTNGGGNGGPPWVMSRTITNVCECKGMQIDCPRCFPEEWRKRYGIKSDTI